MSENETRTIGFHGIEPGPDEACYMPGGQETMTPQRRQQNIGESRDEAAEEKERAAREREKAKVLREQKLRQEAEQHERWMRENAPAIKAALFKLFAEAGIDLSKVAQSAPNERIERIRALAGELKQIAELTKAASPGGLDADTAARMRSCVAEINQLLALAAA